MARRSRESDFDREASLQLGIVVHGASRGLPNIEKLMYHPLNMSFDIKKPTLRC
jgi:hypothetical protein